MRTEMARGFFRDQVDTYRRVVCVFGENVLNEEMKKVIVDCLKEWEYDDMDDCATFHTYEEIEEAAQRIIDGDVLDCDMDTYWIDEVEMYV